MATKTELLKRAEAVLIREEYKERIVWLRYLMTFDLVLIASSVTNFEAWVSDKISIDFINYIL
jgi:hypothetical protein